MGPDDFPSLVGKARNGFSGFTGIGTGEVDKSFHKDLLLLSPLPRSKSGAPSGSQSVY